MVSRKNLPKGTGTLNLKEISTKYKELPSVINNPLKGREFPTTGARLEERHVLFRKEFNDS